MNLNNVERTPEERDIESEETTYLLRSENMKRRLLEAIERDGEGAISLEEARALFGVT